MLCNSLFANLRDQKGTKLEMEYILGFTTIFYSFFFGVSIQSKLFIYLFYSFYFTFVMLGGGAFCNGQKINVSQTSQVSLLSRNNLATTEPILFYFC